jgi:hypothetical protein
MNGFIGIQISDPTELKRVESQIQREIDRQSLLDKQWSEAYSTVLRKKKDHLDQRYQEARTRHRALPWYKRWFQREPVRGNFPRSMIYDARSPHEEALHDLRELLTLVWRVRGTSGRVLVVSEKIYETYLVVSDPER